MNEYILSLPIGIIKLNFKYMDIILSDTFYKGAYRFLLFFPFVNECYKDCHHIRKCVYNLREYNWGSLMGKTNHKMILSHCWKVY